MRDRARYLLACLALALLYFLGAHLGLLIAFVRESATTIWPPTGIAVAALLLFGRRLWPGVALGALVASATTNAPLPAAVFMAVGAAGQAALASWLLERFGGFDIALERIRDVLGLVVLGAITSCIVSATLGTSSLLAFGTLRPSGFLRVWLSWWLGDTIGVILVAPALLTWAVRRQIRWSARRVAELVGFGAALVVVTWVAFGSASGQPFLIAPIVVWAALRFGQRGTATATLVIAVLGTLATVREVGPFVRPSHSQSLLILQAFLGLTGLTAAVLAATFAERVRALQAVEAARAELEERVAQRTAALAASNQALRAEMAERVRVDAALQQSEERYRGVVELSPDGILLVANDLVVFANTAAARILGWPTATALVGRDMLDFVHRDSGSRVRERLRRVVEEGQTQELADERLVKADGEPVEVEITAVSSEHDSKPAVQVMIRDITVRRRLERQLQHAQKMEAVGRLAGGVAHDFNNLLQALLSEVDVLHLRRDDPDGFAAAVRGIGDQVRRGAALARQLLLFARREVVRRQSLDLNALTRGTASFLRRLVRENIQFQIDLAAEPLLVEGDQGQLEQVLANLVVNASDAMPGGGRLVVRTGSCPPRSVFLEVSDTGCGMNSKVQARIFEPFFTTKEVGKGTGLGLAVVDGIVASLGGHIEVASEVGHGTVFRVILPQGGAPAVPAGRPAAAGPDGIPGGRGERLLIVEDEPAAREGLRSIASMLGYVVVAVASGEEAASLPAEPAFDALLVDLLLPGMSGAELGRLLLARWPRVKTIYMSGYTEDEAVRTFVRSDSVHFLQKPFDMTALAHELRAVLGERA